MSCLKTFFALHPIMRLQNRGFCLANLSNRWITNAQRPKDNFLQCTNCLKNYPLVSNRCYATALSEKLKKGAYRFGIILPSKYKYRHLEDAAYVLLNSIYMKVQHTKLRENAGLEDSFNMWTRVVFVHLWCIFMRLKQEGRDGEIVIRKMTNLMWNDLNSRYDKFQDEIKERLKVREIMKENYNAIHMFFAFLDEGILSGDAQLASALWSTIYESNTYESEAWHVEALVHYIRFITNHIDQLEMEELILKPQSLEWPVPSEFL
uniref:Ubiquinol-cytochrome-c reductase complex assembly factor 1-like n=1 Tax=Phallusia mammillata TaxID=59560 RepID=A0A6F9DX29_9ASCI|nr:ubiquinol-cytochrome-c reductase complex assembly factor 1-like [Phallusia mammillata]